MTFPSPIRIEPIDGYSPTIGRLVGMLSYARSTTLAAVDGLTLTDLDHLHDAESNSKFMPASNFLCRRVLPMLLLLGACHTAPSIAPIASSASSGTLSLDDRVAVIDAMDALIRSDFAHWQGLGGQSYDSMVTHFRDQASRSARRWDFDLAALEFAAGLHNGHTSFHDSGLTERHGHNDWFALTPTAEGWMVRSSRVADLARGEIVTSIDGVPTDTVYARQRRYVAQSGERMRQRAWMYSDYLFPLISTVTTASGKSVRIDRAITRPSNTTANTTANANVLVPHRWIVRDSIAYVRVARFSPAAYQDSALAIIKREYAHSPALIVNVRDNGGGNTPAQLIEYLMNGAHAEPMQIESSRILIDKFRGLQRFTPHFGGDHYEGRLVILANSGCASSCEDLVAPFADNRRATVVGDTTWGTSGQPPHVFVTNSRDTLIAGKDEVLDSATVIARRTCWSTGAIQ